MAILVHHRPANQAATWNMHVWQNSWNGNLVVDTDGVVAEALVNFEIPDVDDPRQLMFKFNSATPQSKIWEPDTMIRRLFQTSPAEIWTFDSSPRVLYRDPAPSGATFKAGNVLTFHVLTQSAYRGGKLFVWDPYNQSNPATYFPESSRDDANGASTFSVSLLPWMTPGFHVKLMKPGAAPGGGDLWEADVANRVWRPCDGADVWLKSGQCDIRSQSLALTNISLEVLYGARMANPPGLQLTDVAEGCVFNLTASSSQSYGGNALFKIASYSVPVYLGANYAIASADYEQPALSRPFPANPAAPNVVSRFVLGASAWVSAFPQIAPCKMSIQPQTPSSFGAGLNVDVSLGNGPIYDTQPATLQADGSWQATLQLALNTTTAFDLRPASGAEPKPYDWIDTSRYFTPTAATPVLYTAEGVYGISSQGPTKWAEPANRSEMMKWAYGAAVVSAGVFAERELPHGATLFDGQVCFVVHAPHAARASLVLVDEGAAGGIATRNLVPMSLTRDTFYWWCTVPIAQARSGTRYRFVLNDNTEVLDPASRAVRDQGGLSTRFNEDPNDPTTSWSAVVDVASVYSAAHVHPWQTMGWQNLMVYELHSRRFTNLQPGALSCFDILADELRSTSRLGQAGYLHNLPVTTLGLLPVNEFNSAMGWGYDPSYYFAIDGFYGGADALARFVNAAHNSGRAVMLDVVYNHSLGSSLMEIAPDVYRNGDYDGDRMNCGHPMVLEFLRQAVVYMVRTFNLDGFRFDDTKTILTCCQGGWEFLGTIRNAIHMAAEAEGRGWPYCVAENSAPTAWNVSNPAWGVMDGEWGIDESYRILDSSYATWPGASDNSSALQGEMENPQYSGRHFYQATRFGESHDMVSFQDPGHKRIAARPPYGEGFQMAKALGTLTLLSNGIPMLFMGQEVAETTPFYFDTNDSFVNPQQYDLPTAGATGNAHVLSWFRQLMGLRNDPTKGIQGDSDHEMVGTGDHTVAFTCGPDANLFAIVTFGTPNQEQDSAWLGLPSGSTYKEIFNSSWPAFQVEAEPERSNGGYNAQINSGQILQLPRIGAVVLERAA